MRKTYKNLLYYCYGTGQAALSALRGCEPGELDYPELRAEILKEGGFLR